MDFFDHQDQARKKTSRLIAYFGLAVVCIILALYMVAVALLPLAGFHPKTMQRQKEAWQSIKQGDLKRIPEVAWNPRILLYVSGGACLIIFGGGLIKTLQLGSSGGSVATMLGGVQISPNSNDPEERKVLNVVEEMAIASGMPVPPVYVMNEENSINAFAAGLSPEEAVIGVTRGCIRHLTRDELQAVVAHEFSHILNGDMRLNVRLIGILSGILGLTIIGRIMIRFGGVGKRSGGSDKKSGGALPVVLFGLAMILIGSIGVFFAKLIKSAVSRQREFLADASAVQFTRNPQGLSGALQKIGGLTVGSRIENPAAEEASHLFFGNSLKPILFSGSFLATHPPLNERIRRLDPGWNGRFEPVQIERRAVGDSKKDKPGKFRGRGKNQGTTDPMFTGMAVAAASQISQSIGAPTPEHMDYAVQLLDYLPEEVRQATREPFTAGALIYCLLISNEDPIREAQLEFLKSRGIPGIFREINTLQPLIGKLWEEHHLPLVDLCLPSLRLLSPEQFRTFRANILAIIEYDGEIRLFEFALIKILLRHLDPHFSATQKRRMVQFYSLRSLQKECAGLLSLVAHQGSDTPDAIMQAFRAGAAHLKEIGTDIDLLPVNEFGLQEADVALESLNLISMPLKRQLIDAISHAAATDGRTTRHEAELIRAICDSLECPAPPFLTPKPS